MAFDIPETQMSGPTHPKDVLTGYPVGANGDRVPCCGCRRELRSGMDAVIYAFNLVDSPLWDVPEVYCLRCAPLGIDDPTPGAIEILADAVLGTVTRPGEDTHRICIAEVGIAAYSDPQEGASA